MATTSVQADWSQGYVHDLAYTDNFFAELAPAHLNYVAILNGFRPRPLDRPFTYCELGCGNGQSSTVLAAANPTGQFFACDINPTHVQTARRWAESGKVDNLTFLEASFQQMVSANLPDFDFIVFHGVYSWISAEARRAIAAFMQRKLKPGGLVYNSYNCLPGWSNVAPLQRLMTELSPSDAPDTAARVGPALDAIKELRDLKIAYFAANPGASQFVDRVSGQPKSYLVHEYFNRDWTLFYSADVARELQAAKLTYVGSATLIENHRSVLMGQQAAALLAKQPTRERQELLKDFVINQRFRRDVFAKSIPNLPAAEANRELERVAIGLYKPPTDIAFQIKSPAGEFKFDNQVVRAVVANLADGPLTFAELPERPALKGSPKAEIVKAAHTLLAAGQAIVFASADRRQALPADARRFNLPTALNRALATGAWEHPQRATLASPVAGTGYSLNQIDRALLAAIVEHGMERAFDTAAADVQQRGLTFTKDGKKLEGADANRAELRERFERFVERSMPLLRRLGILEAA
ncbi:MAG TPA: class I SAM-dependent methyltransferase [Candidatus Angelobacter sp.]|nr:class I SAM-dependent methyltransferase [Candidatus Angelobacter sp.]